MRKTLGVLSILLMAALAYGYYLVYPYLEAPPRVQLLSRWGEDLDSAHPLPE